MADEMMFGVYGLICPCCRSLFYVGCSRNPPVRLTAHRTGNHRTTREICLKARENGQTIEIVMFGAFTHLMEAKWLERELVRSMPGLVNSQTGVLSDLLYPRSEGIEYAKARGDEWGAKQ